MTSPVHDEHEMHVVEVVVEHELDAPARDESDDDAAAVDTADVLPNEPIETLPPPCPDLPLAIRIEAVLMGSDRPISEQRLADLLVVTKEEGGVRALRDAVKHLNEQYAETGRCFRVEAVAGGWQMLTTPEVAPILSRMHHARQSSKLTPAALETLAIIAYRQPITRAQIEAIRGVACGEVLRTLLDRRLTKITGRAEEIGRPMLYGTTKEFLRAFGLARLEDLPPAKT